MILRLSTLLSKLVQIFLGQVSFPSLQVGKSIDFADFFVWTKSQSIGQSSKLIPHRFFLLYY